ncbi:hypothetical protein SERLA73DRAFT_102973 [Serpula lacrymans var. lacrymans S7.3]|uniref:U3 small nucleolar RNA-associated protein 10 n=1 Tax=Serpula lacrymans var. lacrymans (strain S7.3) TaxID=936435 RepID=F8PMT8_SERL3|nr:hypothetical protein SERLA73DRAFT_102973 [Serpula lacrymans var. lacrymans S7.3]
MSSSLAAQLAASASLNTSLLLDRTGKRKQTESYLFTGRDADTHDLDSLHALASNAFVQLNSLSPAFSRVTKSGTDKTTVYTDFDQALFSDAARDLDRTMQTREANASLDRTLSTFFRLLGPWLMEAPAGKIIEWLVRRFRINEFNIDDTLALFLPYYESVHFAKMLSILHIKPNSQFSFLLPFKSSGIPLNRTALVTAMVDNADVGRFVAALLPNAMKGFASHRTLLAFNSATMHDFLARMPVLDEGSLAFVLPAFLTPLQSARGEPNAILGSYILLSTLSHKTPLTSAAMSAIIGAMANAAASKNAQNQSRQLTAHFVKSTVAICSPQEEVPAFNAGVEITCLKIPGLAEELCNALRYTGVEKFVLPLLEVLKTRVDEPPVTNLFSTIINASAAPNVIVRRTSAMLVQLAIHTPEESMSAVRGLLSLVHQRHFDVLRTVAEEVVLDDDEQESKKRVEQLLISFSVSHPWAQSTDVNEVVVASTSSTKEVRVHAVGKLYGILQEAEDGKDRTSIHSALLARIYDTQAGVLQALYASPARFLSILSAPSSDPESDSPLRNPKALLTTVIDQITRTSPGRAVLHEHLAFLGGPFVAAYPTFAKEIQEKAFFPYLLASKAKFRTALSVWEALKDCDTETRDEGWLRGCMDIWQDKQQKAQGKDEEDAEKLCTANLRVAAKIAENILASDSPTALTSALSKLQDPLSHGRALGYLVVRALLLCTGTEQQIAISDKVLRAMHLNNLDVLDVSCDKNGGLQKALDDQEVGMKATIKPGGRITLQVLQTSILALLPAIKRPDTNGLDWTADIAPVRMRYVYLLRRLYTLAVASSNISSTHVSHSLLKALFLRLKDDSLAFLLGILISRSSVETADRVRIPALLHVLAFLRGHSATNAVDFQAVIPSLMYVLSDSHKDKRAKALVFECLKALGGEDAKKHVYGFDTIYGAQSADLQYLDYKDLSIYLTALAQQQDQVIQDASYLKVFHQQHFSNANAKYKRRVLCFLLSHVIACPSPAAKIALLRSIEDVADSSKSRLLFPHMKELAEKSDLLSESFGSTFNDYVTLLVAACLTVSAADLNDQKSDSAWPTFISSLRYHFQSNSPSSTRQLFSGALQNGLYNSLSFERQTEICNVLLQAGSEGGEAYLHSKALLGIILQDSHMISHLLSHHQPNVLESDPRATKRAKLDDVGHTDAAVGNIPSLTLLAEVLGTKDLPGSLDLISSVLETMSKVAHQDSQGASDTNYIVQMLMSAVENIANKIKEVPPRAIRLDILLELIRVSDNPQTFHQALLLMGSLARLTPDSVLHNVMPIFTFMGSNIFHRDDSYSFKVTIESIVPVMASSLKTKYSDGLDLYVGSRDFLRIFTDACGHIPRHRRSNFFVHLVEVLGAHEFLAPVCMLLVDRTANRVSRQRPEEAQTSMALPISVLHHFSKPVQLYVSVETLQESLRLMSHVVDKMDPSPAFLEYYRDEEQPTPSSSILKRRAQALITFVGCVMQPSSPTEEVETVKGASTTALMALFIRLVTMEDSKTPESSLGDIYATTQQSMVKALNIMAVADFMVAVLTLLQSDEDRIQIGALELLTERLPRIQDKARRDSLETITLIIERIKHFITVQSGGALVVSALNALTALGKDMCPGEEAALAATLPSIIKIMRVRTAADTTLAVLPSLVLGLGPRIIPHFRDIVRECTLILQEEQSTTVDNALNTLQSLLSSLPAFWSKSELTPIIDIHLSCYTSAATTCPTTTLIKAIAKRIPAKALLPTVHDSWWSIDQSKKTDVDSISGFFFILKRSLHAAPRAEVLAQLRPTFKVFLDALDLRTISSTEVKKEETQVISAFLELVVKLNDSAFKPLFRRLYDWAFASDIDSKTRKVTFCRVYIALLEYFKGLMNPYMSLLLQPVCDMLKTSSDASIQDRVLLSCVLDMLIKSLDSDDGAFWRDDKLRQLVKPLVDQVATCIKSDVAEEKDLLVKVLSAVTGSVTDDALLKTINLDILMHTRSEDVRLRVYALSCVGTLWQEHGGKLLGFVAETATFIGECAEDENDTVVKEAHKLKSAVENIAGNINGL